VLDFLLQPKAKSEHEGSFNLADIHLRVQRGAGVLQNVRPHNLKIIVDANKQPLGSVDTYYHDLLSTQFTKKYPE